MTTPRSESNRSRDAAAAIVLEELANEHSQAMHLIQRAEVWASRFVRSLDMTPHAEMTQRALRDREACRLHLAELRAFLGGDLTQPRKES